MKEINIKNSHAYDPCTKQSYKMPMQELKNTHIRTRTHKSKKVENANTGLSNMHKQKVKNIQQLC